MRTGDPRVAHGSHIILQAWRLVDDRSRLGATKSSNKTSSGWLYKRPVTFLEACAVNVEDLPASQRAKFLLLILRQSLLCGGSTDQSAHGITLFLQAFQKQGKRAPPRYSC